jgi:hypothetical protein
MTQRRLHEQKDIVGEMDDGLAVSAQVAQRAGGVEGPEDQLLLPLPDAHRRAVDRAV